MSCRVIHSPADVPKLEAELLPVALLSLLAFVAMPFFQDETVSRQLPEAPLSVRVAAGVATGTTSSGLDTAIVVRRVVERTADFLRAAGFKATAVDASGFVVSGTVAAGGAAKSEPQQAPGKALTLSIELNSSRLQAASGVETRFGGDGEAAWRLAYDVQKNVVSGLRDVMGYEVYDRGIQERDSPAGEANLAPAQSSDPWVVAVPMFATNGYEATLLGMPGTQDVLAVALSNAISDYLDPSKGVPRRSAQAGWSRTSTWEPVEPRAIYKADDSPKLALTYDAGASSAPTPAILKALRDAGVHATIFLTADYVERNPALVVQMAQDGHELGNHSSTHPDMTTISDREIISELDRLESDVVALTGKSTRPWFRPPYGAVNDRVLRTVASQGYQAIMWTADSADWRDDIAPSTVAARLLRYAEPGAILIEHLGSPQSAEVLPQVLKTLTERGFVMGTLSEVVGRP